MKKLTVLPLTFLLVVSVFAQNITQVISEAKKLRTADQNYAALQKLSTSPRFSAEVVHEILDILIAPNAYTNKYFKHFIIDEKDQNGQKARREFDYPLFDLVAAAIDSFPTNCVILSDVARVYEKWMRFDAGFWAANDMEGLKETIEYYVQPKCPDYLSNYLIGFAYSYLGNTNKALPFLQKAVTLNQSSVPALTAYADALRKSKNNEAALVHAKKAVELTRSRSRGEQSTAALVLGKVYNAMNDDANALHYLFAADTLRRADYFNLHALLEFYLKTDIKKAGETANRFIGGLDRTNINYYLDVMKLYTAYNKLPELQQWCTSYMANFKDRPEVLACFNFTLGMIYKASDPGKAKMYFGQAKSGGLTSDKYNATYLHPDTPKTIDEAYKIIE